MESNDDDNFILGILPEDTLSDAPEPRSESVLSNVPEPRLKPAVRGSAPERLDPVLSSAPEPSLSAAILGLPLVFNPQKISFKAKIACFMPALPQFKNKHPWYLTVIEDSRGVRHHPIFLPASEFDVRT